MSTLILITRPRDGAETFAARLRDRLGPDADICVAPLIEIVHLDGLPDLAQFGSLIFTSAHAVASFAGATPRRDFTCYVVGEATAEAARGAGFTPLTGSGTGRDLAEMILRGNPATPCLYVRGKNVALDLAHHLNAAGTETEQAIVYRQDPVPLDDAALTRISQSGNLVAPVFSAQSARLLLEALPMRTSLQIAAISKAVADLIPADRTAQVEVAMAPDASAMLDCVAALWSNANRLEGRGTAQ